MNSRQVWDNLIVGFSIGFFGTIGVAMAGTSPVNLINLQNACGVGIATALAAFKDPNKMFVIPPKNVDKVDG